MTKAKGVIFMKNRKVVNDQKEAQKKPETGKEAKETTPNYPKGYEQGFQSGFKLGLGTHPDVESVRRLGFDEGVKYIITLAENFLVEHEKLGSREDLIHGGFNKLPSWWIATLVTALHYEPPSQAVPKAPQGSQKNITEEPVPFEPVE